MFETTSQYFSMVSHDFPMIFSIFCISHAGYARIFGEIWAGLTPLTPQKIYLPGYWDREFVHIII